jgi:hypothetical protein
MAGIQTQNEEAVLISLEGQGLDDAVYQTYDLSTLENLLGEQTEPDGIGELDGHETGPTQNDNLSLWPQCRGAFFKGAACSNQLSPVPERPSGHSPGRFGFQSARDTVPV